jgi:hypothetical protein
MRLILKRFYKILLRFWYFCLISGGLIPRSLLRLILG